MRKSRSLKLALANTAKKRLLTGERVGDLLNDINTNMSAIGRGNLSCGIIFDMCMRRLKNVLEYNIEITNDVYFELADIVEYHFIKATAVFERSLKEIFEDKHKMNYAGCLDYLKDNKHINEEEYKLFSEARCYRNAFSHMLSAKEAFKGFGWDNRHIAKRIGCPPNNTPFISIKLGINAIVGADLIIADLVELKNKGEL